MPHNIWFYTGIYFVAISMFAILQVLYDKHAAKGAKHRISERALLLVSAIGGSVAMLTAMHVVRHKTKHIKFMLGIPVIIILQIALVTFIWWQLNMRAN